MKPLILLILQILSLARVLMLWDHTLSITIDIPTPMAPYYEWLLDFPGWSPVPYIRPQQVLPLYIGFRSVTPGNDSVIFSELAGNTPGLSC